ncbi:MAG: ABC transporter permease subunit [Dethiobacter sp.]|jgi:peptide/nickel transport system permease protein/nickel transport system permease protein|nr:ABC transporter permease subunit [Dethiobacter sp.]MBS3901088.1 ABC transporter permease subunit [Dethiobacter sp.]MBS3989053.1 ABC transporter permease subunit [Dethiobacter sp.]
MGRFVARRIISLVPVLLGISLLTFVLIHLVPVDPAEVYLRLSQIPPTDEAVAVIRAEMGLNKPLHQQYFDWLWKVVHLDFGKSFVTKKPVMAELLYYFPATLNLAAASLLIVLLISIPVGVFSALYKDTAFDQICRILAFIGASMPSFWLSFVLIYILSLELNLLPAFGRGTLAHLVLPATTLALGAAAVYTRLLRTSMLENLNQNFVLYARARGLKEKLIVVRHVLKNALIPVVIAFGMTLGHMLAGSVIVENVFAWPGVGRYIVSSIFNRDYPVIQAYALFMAVVFVLLNLFADIICATLDPRIRLGGDK